MAATPWEAVSLATHMKNLLRTGEYSDLNLKCGDKIFLVHKSVVCRFEFFATAVKHDFLEAASGVIDFPDERPEIIFALLQHLYERDYSVPETLTEADFSAFHVQIYAAAEKYLLPTLKKLATANIVCLLGYHEKKKEFHGHWPGVPPQRVPNHTFLETIRTVWDADVIDSTTLMDLIMLRATRNAGKLFKYYNGRQFLEDNPKFAASLSWRLCVLYGPSLDSVIGESPPKSKHTDDHEWVTLMSEIRKIQSYLD